MKNLFILVIFAFISQQAFAFDSRNTYQCDGATIENFESTSNGSSKIKDDFIIITKESGPDEGTVLVKGEYKLTYAPDYQSFTVQDAQNKELIAHCKEATTQYFPNLIK